MTNGSGNLSTPDGGGGWTPVPDPTKLTTDAVNAATSAYRRDLAALRELFETRLKAMDKATELLAATVGKVPSDTDKAVSALKDLLGARIDGMDTATKLLAAQVSEVPTATDKAVTALKQIMLGEIRSVQDVASEKFAAIDGTFASNALALTAALAAQKEAAAEQNKSNTLAITKSEAATKETVAANAAQAASGRESLAREVADLKERLVRLESGGVAVREGRVEGRANRAELSQTVIMIVMGLSALIAIVSVIAFIIKK